MMEGACQSWIKQLIDLKNLDNQTETASKSTTSKASQSQSTGVWSFGQFEQASNNLKDWRAVKTKFRECKYMVPQHCLSSSNKPVA